MTDIRIIHEINQRLKGCSSKYIYCPNTGCAIAIYSEKTFDKARNPVLVRPISINIATTKDVQIVKGLTVEIDAPKLYAFTNDLKKSSAIDVVLGENSIIFNTTSSTISLNENIQLTEDVSSIQSRIFEDMGKTMVTSRIYSADHVKDNILSKENPYFIIDIDGYRLRVSKSEVATINGKEDVSVMIHESKSLPGYYYAVFKSRSKLFDLYSILKFKNF